MRIFSRLILSILLVALLGACTTTSSKGSTASTDVVAGETYNEPDFYYDFDDILIPKEIEYNQEESYKLDNTKFRAAIMEFSGRVDGLELVQFFLNNMAKDNWTLVSNNKTGKLSVLQFEKFNKSCSIQVNETFNTTKAIIIAVEVKDLADRTKE